MLKKDFEIFTAGEPRERSCAGRVCLGWRRPRLVKRTGSIARHLGISILG